MACFVQPHESEITAAFDFSNFVSTTAELQVCGAYFGVGIATIPLELVSPLLVPKPIANEISVPLQDDLVSILCRNETDARHHLQRRSTLGFSLKFLGQGDDMA